MQMIAESNYAVMEDLRSLRSGQTQTEAILTTMNENLLLSDRIKSIAFRRKDQAVLESAINQDIRSNKWDSARRLIKELEDRYGDRREARKLTGEMERCKNLSVSEKVKVAITHMESLWMLHNYREAQQYEEEILKQYPDNDHIQKLAGSTEDRRLNQKKELLGQLEKASHDNDLERGVDVLRLLDNYLTATEAAALRESARDVFRARLYNMGVQFSLFVTEKSWEKALKVGREIVKEYPKSRMAQEVREKIDILAERASVEA